MTESQRPDPIEYFLKLADAASLRSTCTRRQVGCVIVNADREVVSTGYNGAPRGEAHCIDGACPRGKLSYEELAASKPYDDPTLPGYCIAVHAELNAALSAGRDRARGGTAFVTAEPCPGCWKTLTALGLSCVIWRKPNGGHVSWFFDEVPLGNWN